METSSQQRYAAITLANEILFRKISETREAELIIQGNDNTIEKIELTQFHTMETLIEEAEKIFKFIHG